jgi:transglutaminase/protease-like cytokinesis protein 3
MNAITKSYWCASRRPVQWRKSDWLRDSVYSAVRKHNTLDKTTLFHGLCDYLNRFMQYDWFKATDIRGGVIKTYVPDIDSILIAKKGICLDFAVVLCAMCRSCGIPCKVVYGYTTTITGRLYHAWVSAYYDGAWHDYDPTYAKLGVKNFKYERKAER